MDITPIAEAAVVLIAAVVATFVVPYIQSRIGVSRQTELAAWVRVAVEAAEQLFRGEGRGAEKKQYVLDWLKERGMYLDADKIDALVESAVYKLTEEKP